MNYIAGEDLTNVDGFVNLFFFRIRDDLLNFELPEIRRSYLWARPASSVVDIACY